MPAADASSPAPAPRVLVVDDEPHVRKFLCLSLQAENFEVLEAGTAEEAIVCVHAERPDVMVLDLGLPDIDGQDVLRDVRLISDLPILVLTARTEESEKIAALERGADDYMTKPFTTHNLIQRLRAALIQQKLYKGQDTVAKIRTGSLCIGLDTPEVKRGQSAIALDDEEYALLRLLAQHGGRVLTFGRLERALWGENPGIERRRDLQRRINGLRRKVEFEPAFPRYILTEPSVGYRLEMLPAGDLVT